MGMVEVKSCELYECCIYRNFAGSCHSSCIKNLDTVLVVRCKDCKHMKIDRNGYRWCLVWTGINGMGDEGFCNYGERKDNENP